jgi:hypothetical protein
MKDSLVVKKRMTELIVQTVTLCLLFVLPIAAFAAHRREFTEWSRAQHDLAGVRNATAEFQSIERAEEAHYHLGIPSQRLLPLDNCIAHPTAGAMGYHYFNQDLIYDDIETLDPLRPEGLVYAPGPNGTRQLAAVEYVIPVAAWQPRGMSDRPSSWDSPCTS